MTATSARLSGILGPSPADGCSARQPGTALRFGACSRRPFLPLTARQPASSSRRARLQQLSASEDALAESVYAVNIVGVAAEQQELTAAADTRSRLNESPLCYFQWCAPRRSPRRAARARAPRAPPGLERSGARGCAPL